ncbi:hypothetical protein AMS69_12290 [Haloarcula rubripromontorii]|uniref:Uncharacterized protein n=1 Tax=Haloarcula rubripromontorii TaxID=1705562 RepID=A0A0M9AKB7_9EURY|nr:pilin [Haloarcula rubripromontorii]KOX93208.1 hypothetical protein AMS69_12290 [Haloarcula rubripromontorii]
MSTRTQNSTASTSESTLYGHAKRRLADAWLTPGVRETTQLLLILTLFAGSAMGQTDVGNIYCDTAVEDGVNVVFGALAGLGLPATMVFVGRSGLSYMRASGNPNQQNEARRDLILSLVGLGVVVLAIVAPELITKFGDNVGFGFSDCVTPF